MPTATDLQIVQVPIELEEAKAAGSYTAYTTSIIDHPSRNPYTSISHQVAACTRQEVGKATD